MINPLSFTKCASVQELPGGDLSGVSDPDDAGWCTGIPWSPPAGLWPRGWQGLPDLDCWNVVSQGDRLGRGS